MSKVAMLKLYQFTSVIIVIIFFTGCGGSATVKKDSKKGNTDKTQTLGNSTSSATLSSNEKIKQAESLFEAALSSATTSDSEKSNLLSRALLLCTQVLADSHQAKLSNTQATVKVSPEQYDYTLQLTNKILSSVNPAGLSQEQKNQQILTTATISLINYQLEETLAQLNLEFYSTQDEQWSLYYQLRAMADFQSGQASKAVNELIIRHSYLLSEAGRQANSNIIWRYLSAVNLSASPLNTQTTDGKTLSDNDGIYLGWLKLAQIMRDSKDPQTMNYAINFWFQKYPSHQADRAFVNNIIRLRQASIINVSHIAVLLPLQGKLEKPAKAIRDGIMASHYNSPLSSNTQLRFYNTETNEHISTTYQQAVDNGADFVIGPLAKSNLEALSESLNLSTITLALNSLEIDTTTKGYSPSQTQNLFQFGLSPESAARRVAEKGRQDGHYYAAVIAPDNNWGQRMKKAFTIHWQQSGGVVVETINYDSKAHDFSDSIKSMLNIDLSESRKKEVSRTIGRKLEYTPRRRQDIDMLFMAAFPRQAKQIPLQIIYHHGETIPIYSTSHIVSNYHNARQNIDMDSVNFSDMPFLLGAVQGTTSQENTYQSTLYQRLFAMGVDSYQLAPYVNYLHKNPAESFSGDSGVITIKLDGHIIRSLPWATFDQGNIKLQNVSSSVN